MSNASSATPARCDTSLRSYEELRERVLSGSSRGGHAGLVVLVREGIGAWLARPRASRSPIRSATLGGESASAVAVSEDFHASLVRVLANIAVAHAHREEMNA